MMTASHPEHETRDIAVSVIVPVWNEQADLPGCLRSVGLGRPGVEVIVVDGGSSDGSVGVALRHGARVVPSPVRQRAAQLNLGAAQAQGALLLFLHADTVLPRNWPAVLGTAFATGSGVVGGAFARRFESSSAWLAFTAWLADWRGRLAGIFLGDQAMVVRRAVFRRLGGFAELDTCEDLEFCGRLARAGRTVLLRPVVRTSARRFARRGPVLQTIRDLVQAVRFFTSRRALTPAGNSGVSHGAGLA